MDIRIAMNHGDIELEIRDDGIGVELDFAFESSAGRSMGLLGMKERAELTGGALTIDSAPNKGTAVRVAWPVNSALPHRRASLCAR